VLPAVFNRGQNSVFHMLWQCYHDLNFKILFLPLKQHCLGFSEYNCSFSPILYYIFRLIDIVFESGPYLPFHEKVPLFLPTLLHFFSSCAMFFLIHTANFDLVHLLFFFHFITMLLCLIDGDCVYKLELIIYLEFL